MATYGGRLSSLTPLGLARGLSPLPLPPQPCHLRAASSSPAPGHLLFKHKCVDLLWRHALQVEQEGLEELGFRDVGNINLDIFLL